MGAISLGLWAMRTLIAMTALSASLAAAGCTQVDSVRATRSTPAGTIAMFACAADRRDLPAQWEMFSPALQRRLRRPETNGITDYESPSAPAHRRARRERIHNVLPRPAVVRDVAMQGPGRARVCVASPRGVVSVGLVRLTKWQLYLVGDFQPYEGFTNDDRVRCDRGPRGRFTVSARFDPSRPAHRWTFSAEKVARFREFTRWYIDDLGARERSLKEGR